MGVEAQGRTRPGSAPERGRRNLVVAPILAAAGLAAFTLWLALGLGGLRTTVAVDDIGEAVAAGIATLACAMAAIRASNRRRLGWSLLSASALSWTLGEIAWSVYEVGMGMAVPFPSPADAGFLFAVPLGITGLLALPHAPTRANSRARSILDGSIIGLSLLFVGWAFVLGPVYSSSGSSPLSQLLGLAYPVGDVLIASVVLIIASRASGPERLRFLLLLGGFLANAVADSAFAYLTGAGVYTVRGSVFDAAWVAGFLLIALAALWPAAQTSATEEGTIRSWQVAVPGIAFAAATASAFVLAATGRPLGANLTVLAAGVGLLLVCSHLLSLADTEELRRAKAVAEEMLGRLEGPVPEGPAEAFSPDRRRSSAVFQTGVFERLQKASEVIGEPEPAAVPASVL